VGRRGTQGAVVNRFLMVVACDTGCSSPTLNIPDLQFANCGHREIIGVFGVYPLQKEKRQSGIPALMNQVNRRKTGTSHMMHV
jgi:hypothetical protein